MEKIDWGLLVVMFCQGKIDALTLKILDCVVNQGMNKSETGRALGVSHVTVINRMRQLTTFLTVSLN